MVITKDNKRPLVRFLKIISSLSIFDEMVWCCAMGGTQIRYEEKGDRKRERKKICENKNYKYNVKRMKAKKPYETS